MRFLRVLVLISALIFLNSCSPTVSTKINKSYSPLDYKDDVVLFVSDESIPDNYEVLGQIRIGDSGFTTKCSYNIVIDKAKLEARKIGGKCDQDY